MLTIKVLLVKLMIGISFGLNLLNIKLMRSLKKSRLKNAALSVFLRT